MMHDRIFRITLLLAVGFASIASAESRRDDADPTLLPRLQVRAPSMHNMVREIHRSHSGVFVERFTTMIRELGADSADGLDMEEAQALFDQVKTWPDTSLALNLFAADTRGRDRWAVHLSWPAGALADRLAGVLATPAATTLLQNISIEGRGDGFVIALRGQPLAHIRNTAAGAILSSHPDLVITPAPTGGADMLTCQLNLAGTEEDSGATWLSGFRAISHVVYTAHVDDTGAWQEEVAVHWPPIAGMGAKAFFERIKQKFYVPAEAYGSAVMSSLMTGGLLENTLGFGPQMMMDGGQFEMVGEIGPGPIATAIRPDLCMTVLPGTGFFPAPDVVVQARTKKPEKLIDSVREEIKSINALYREREQDAPWTETTVRDRAVFWRKDVSSLPGVMMPLSSRTVLFTTSERVGEKERSFLVAGWTSTAPEKLVERWLSFPRGTAGREMPVTRKTNGQLWINWATLYRFLLPYVNAALSATVRDTLLPSADDIAEHLADATVTFKITYDGLNVAHTGPIPCGVIAIPTLTGLALEDSLFGDSDLARERVACERLEVLFHHAKLFKTDLGRWPAEVAELDGYVDFSGHPELLALRQSAKKRWASMFDDLLGSDEQDTFDDDEEPDDDLIDDSLYVITWGTDTWRLGYAQDTLDHLDELYIDHTGTIHRVPKEAAPADAPKADNVVEQDSPAEPAPDEPAQHTEPDAEETNL